MKYLKILLTFVLAIVVFNTNNAASVVAVSDAASSSWHATPKNQVKKEKAHKKNKTFSKKQFFKKLLGSGGISSTLAIVLCILLAPLSFLWVGLYTGWEGSAWLITLLLTLLFVLPAVIYAIIVILSN
jgi:uncharacterized membrane protein YqaE (UPF0057 family)